MSSLYWLSLSLSLLKAEEQGHCSPYDSARSCCLLFSLVWFTAVILCQSPSSSLHEAHWIPILGILWTPFWFVFIIFSLLILRYNWNNYVKDYLQIICVAQRTLISYNIYILSMCFNIKIGLLKLFSVAFI